MNELKAAQLLTEINMIYNGLKEPKYKQLSLNDWEEYKTQLQIIKQFLKNDTKLKKLYNAISQITSRIEKLNKIHPIKGVTQLDENRENLFLNPSERGVNKAIPCLRNINDFIWHDTNTGVECAISNGKWNAKNSMLLDILSYMLLMKIGGDRFPKDRDPIFDSVDTINSHESKIKSHTHIEPTTPEKIKKKKYYIKFTDKQFSELTSKKLNSNSILDLIRRTSRVEFKLVYPVRMISQQKAKEKLHPMQCYSRLFEFGFRDKKIRQSDGVVLKRKYYISFHTFLGELFVHNLKTENFDWIHREFYNLPDSAQIFYKRYILIHDYKSFSIGLPKIAMWLNFSDKNMPNLISTVESNVLEPLKECKLIENFVKEWGSDGWKYKIRIRA